jgi:hypothetical protein
MTNAQIVALLGERLWGPRWVIGMGEFTGINRRTLERILSAARAGQEYAAARGVIAALHERLTAVVTDLTPWAQRADEER